MPNFVTAIIIHEKSLLMVKHQGPDDPAPFWSLVGGKVEAGENAYQALIREVKEETGLDVELEAIGTMLYQTFIELEGQPTEAQIFEVTRWTGDFDIQDPDGLVMEVAFIPLEQAINTEIPKIGFRPMFEPLLSYLRGDSPAGSVWRYRHSKGVSELLEE
jgi:8-oxo-dGTP pyrophosphatase MutT (NUDIX family)